MSDNEKLYEKELERLASFVETRNEFFATKGIGLLEAVEAAIQLIDGQVPRMVKGDDGVALETTVEASEVRRVIDEFKSHAAMFRKAATEAEFKAKTYESIVERLEQATRGES